MRMNHQGGTLLASVVAVAFCWASAANGADPLTLKSATFQDGAMMPKKVSNNPVPSNANCVGENISPQLSWFNAPAGTKSFALTIVDPEGRGGAGAIHFIGYGIPASVTSFAEGELSKDSEKYVGGMNTLGVGHYSGPCTPAGNPHHYTFVLIATDVEPKDLPSGLAYPELHAKLAGHAKGTASLIGLFVKPTE